MTEKHLKSKGIILRQIDFKEADQIVTVLTEEAGKISLITKGSKRLKSKFCGKLEMFNLGDFNYFQGKELGYLNELESFCLLPEHLDLKSRALLFYMAEVTLKLLPEHQECPEVYHLLCQTLTHFETPYSEALFYGYMIKLLTQLGFMSDWSKSSQNQEKLDLEKPHFFSVNQGSLYHATAAMESGDLKMNPAVIKWIYFMQKEEVSSLKNIQANPQQKNEVHQILKLILHDIFERSFRSESFMETLMYQSF